MRIAKAIVHRTRDETDQSGRVGVASIRSSIGVYIPTSIALSIILSCILRRLQYMHNAITGGGGYNKPPIEIRIESIYDSIGYMHTRLHNQWHLHEERWFVRIGFEHIHGGPQINASRLPRIFLLSANYSTLVSILCILLRPWT